MKKRYQYLHPFSHKFGSSCLIPKTSYVVQAFPSKLFISSLEDLTTPVKEIDLPVSTILSKFTLQQDLESLCVRVFSEKFSFYITKELEVVKKRPKREQGLERLCFGVTKKQEMERIYARADMQEILPIWFRLGQLIDLPALEEKEGIFSLIDICERKINSSSRDEILPAFMNLFRAGFSSIFLPRTKDDEWQNLFPSVQVNSSALHLYCEGWRLIRQLFFIEKEDKLQFLPHLPSKLPYGKLYDLQWKGGKIHIEWTKHKLRKITLFVQEPREISLVLPPEIKSFRFLLLNSKKKEVSANEPLLQLQEKGVYILDRFEK